jgi:hypothetical protein
VRLSGSRYIGSGRGNTRVVDKKSASLVGVTERDAGGEKNEEGGRQGSRVEGRGSRVEGRRVECRGSQRGRGIDECVGSCKPKPKHGGEDERERRRGRKELGVNDRVCTEYMSMVSGSRYASDTGRGRD